MRTRILDTRFAGVLGFTGFALVLGGCRIGGPAHEFEQPSLDASWPLPAPEAGPPADEAAVPVDDVAVPIGDTATPADETSMEASAADASVAEGNSDSNSPDDGIEAATDADDEASAPEADLCTPGTSIYCDPVHNTGCTNARCDVSGTLNTGVCVWIPGLYGVGHGCTTSGPALGFLGTDTCNPKLTCLSGTCVALCYCDADCASGEHCTRAIGSTGFMACAP